MKKLVFILISFFIVKILFAQSEVKYIFNSKSDIEYDFFLGPECKVGKMIEGYQVYAGMKAAVIFNKKFAFGVAGGGFITETVFEGLNDMGEEALLNTVMAYGGFYFDYIIPTGIPLQISFPTLLGASGVTLFASAHNIQDRADEEMVEGGIFFIFEPAINLELNITSFMRIGLGGGYRLAVKGDMDRLSARDLSDPTFNFNMKFGSF